MSRTYRRTNDILHKYNYVGAWYEDYEHSYQEYPGFKYQTYKLRSALYHSDKYSDWSAPKTFRTTFNRILRRRNKNILQRNLREDKDYQFIPHLNTIKYLYF